MKKLIFFIGVFAALTFNGCKKSDTSGSGGGAVDCSGTAPKFSTDAASVFQSKCATNSGCHAAGATNSGGVLTTHSEIFNKRSNIRSSVSNGSMPQGGSLSAAEKKAIICWIDAGAMNN